MTRDISAENFAALQSRSVVPRDFVWFTVRDRDSGDAVFDGYWSDDYDTVASVIDPETGGAVERSWAAAGGLISISDIPHVSTLSVQTVTITLSQVSSRINDLLRGYDCKQGRVEIYRGFYDPETRAMAAPAVPRFIGYIDEAPIRTPKENAVGDVELSCTSHTQELMRSNPDTRSDASQRLRSATDNFFQDAAVVGGWQIWWGKTSGAPS